MKLEKIKRIAKAFMPLIILFMILIWPASEYNRTEAQIPVTDGAAGAALSQVNVQLMQSNFVENEMAGVQAEMAAVQAETSAMTAAMKQKQEAMEAADKAIGYVKDLKALYQVTQLFSQLICTYQTLSFMLKKNGSLQICHINAHYSMAVLDIQGAVDLVKLVVRGGLKMDQGVRIANLKQAIDLLNRGHAKMMMLSHSMNVSNVRRTNSVNYWASNRKSANIYKY